MRRGPKAPPFGSSVSFKVIIDAALVDERRVGFRYNVFGEPTNTAVSAYSVSLVDLTVSLSD